MTHRIIGVGAFVYGVLLLLSPDTSFGGPVWMYLFDVLPRTLVCVAFMAAGFVGAVCGGRLVGCLVLTGWLLFWWAQIVRIAVIGATPWSSVVPWAVITTLSLYTALVRANYERVR